MRLSPLSPWRTQNLCPNSPWHNRYQRSKKGFEIRIKRTAIPSRTFTSLLRRTIRVSDRRRRRAHASSVSGLITRATPEPQRRAAVPLHPLASTFFQMPRLTHVTFGSGKSSPATQGSCKQPGLVVGCIKPSVIEYRTQWTPGRPGGREFPSAQFALGIADSRVGPVLRELDRGVLITHAFVVPC